MTTTMKKMIGSALLGATVLGGVATVGAGVASAAPGPGVNQGNHGRPAAPHQVIRNGQNPNWRPGPVFHQGGWHQPVWNAGMRHWGFWLGPIWIPIG